MKATYASNYITIAGTDREASKINAVANNLLHMGYEDTKCGGDDECEFWVILKTFCPVAESKQDYRKSKEGL